jgi:hypothetical protein
MSKVIWSSTVTEEMVTNLNDEQVSELIDSLNDAVQQIVEELGGKV